MIQPPSYILLIPQAMATDPRFTHLRSPVTIEHSPVKCPKCGSDCWIGPKQKFMASLTGMQTRCYTCILEDERYIGFDIVSLNPGIENVPRRNGQA